MTTHAMSSSSKRSSAGKAKGAQQPVSTPPDLTLRALRIGLGVSLVFFVFYIGAHYLWGLSFPTPLDLLQIGGMAFGGVFLGLAFSRVWPLPARPGFERIVRLILLMIPALGLGIALHVLLQGAQAERALYLVFAVAAWLGSGLLVRHAAD